MKKEIYFFVGMFVLLMVAVVHGGVFSWVEETITGKVSSQSTSVAIQVRALLSVVTIISPIETTYSTSSILLNYTAERAVDVWYNLNNGINISLNSSKLLTLSEGSYTLYLFANNSEGNENFTSVDFSVDLSAPGDGGGGGGGGGGEIIETPAVSEETEIIEEIFDEEEFEELKNSGVFPKKKHFLLEFEYNQGNLILISKIFEEGFYSFLNHDLEKEYRINSYSKEGRLLYSDSFHNPGQYFSDGFDEGKIIGGIEDLEKAIFYLRIPAQEDLDKIEILRKNKKIFETQI